MAQFIACLALAAAYASAADVCDARTGCADEFSALQGSAAPELYVQPLTNYKDIEYTTHITIGQQTFRAVVDTGSHELLVVSSRCLSVTCQTARQHYKGDKDTGYKTFDFNQHHQYGTAALTDKLSKDEFHVGTLASREQYFWEITSAPGMKSLTEGTFEAILGLGNPYHAAMEAAEWKHLDEMEWAQSGCKDLKTLDENSTCSDIDDRIDFHSFAVKSHTEHPPAVLPGLGVKVFSVCFGVYSGSDGVIRWNDINPSEQTGFFSHLNVVGRSDWSVPLTSPSLSGAGTELSLGCEKGEKCEAIFDTGSSIIMAPSEVVSALVDTLNNASEGGRLDCANLNEFPDLLLTLDGHQIRIPPEAYIGEVVGTSDSTRSNAIKKLRNLRLDVDSERPVQAPGMDYHSTHAATRTAATGHFGHDTLGSTSRYGRSGSAPGRVPGQSRFAQSYNQMTYGRATRRPPPNKPFYFKGHKSSSKEMDELVDKFDAGMKTREQVKRVKFGQTVGKHQQTQRLETEEQAALRALQEEARRQAAQPKCTLLMMASDLGTDTASKAWVLGMPFFRHFFTTFEATGDDYSKRKVHIAPNDGKCNHPFDKRYMSLRKERNAGSRITTVDFSKIRMPRVYFDNEEAYDQAEDEAEEAAREVVDDEASSE